MNNEQSQSSLYVNNYDGENLLFFCPVITETSVGADQVNTSNDVECCGNDPVELNTSSNTFDEAFSSTNSSINNNTNNSNNNNVQTTGEHEMHQFLNEITDYLNENSAGNGHAQNTHDANNPPDELKNAHFDHGDFFSYPNEVNDYAMRTTNDNDQPDNVNTSEFLTFLHQGANESASFRQQTNIAFKQEHVITMNSGNFYFRFGLILTYSLINQKVLTFFLLLLLF